jgi:SagB-type dehydrogenase family enzyme
MNNPYPNRMFLRADTFKRLRHEQSDQQKGLPFPPPQKPCPPEADTFKLVAPSEMTVGRMPLFDAIQERRSVREYTGQALTLEELSFLCWATQGVHSFTDGGLRAHRTAPSGGARHPFETYLSVQRVEGLQSGLYRYLAYDHKLAVVFYDPHMADKIGQACSSFAGRSAVTFIWSVIPYRMEWRYREAAYKIIAQDSGHVCQNLYLACQAIRAGACAVGAYEQDAMDALVGLDGQDEFTVYCAPVGKVPG